MTQTNIPADLALKFIQNTGTNLFLTGKAGTGKTTFLKRLKELSPKRMVVVAPTGVAAINAGGVTIHSFFQLPFGPYIPGKGDGSDFQNRSFSHKFNRDKINILKSLDLLVIDEISMVRADLLDAISDLLRRYRDRHKPFGGVQLLLIGDLQQLAPVVKDDEWNLLKDYYASPYFFDSNALSESNYFSIELTHVYRQSDDDFVRLLNKIRDNQPDDETIRRLNERYIPNFTPDEKDGYITLTTHNYQANQINAQKLAGLSGRAYTFNSEIANEFPSYSYPTDEQLVLKNGAQVMFVKNDSSGERKYYNGKIGKVVFINENRIVVRDESGQEITVNKESWQNVKYTINDETKEITETIVGSFTQYPLKTAWAITIHKSQGLTFDRAIIDAAAAFSHGQVYVALSRCKTLDGLVLNSRINRESLVTDLRIDSYTSSLKDKEACEDQLNQSQRQYFLRLVSELFDFGSLQQRIQYAAHLIYSNLSRLYPEWSSRYAASRDQFRSEVTEVGIRFQQQLNRMINNSENYATDENIQERIRKGSAYFIQTMEKYRSLLSAADLEIDNKEVRKQIDKAVINLTDEYLIKLATLHASKNEFSIYKYLSAKAKAQLEPSSPPKRKRDKRASTKKGMDEAVSVTEDVRHPVLYAYLKKWRNETAASKGLPVYTILQQKAIIGISNLLPVNKGELLRIPGIGNKVAAAYGPEILAIVKEYQRQLSEKTGNS